MNMSDFWSDLKEMPSVKCPANSVSQLYKYVHDLSRILDRHASLVSSFKTKQHADWLSETYRLAKSLRHQFEPAWRKDKSQYNRSRFSFISKLVECVVAKQLVHHIHGHGLDNSYQSAYTVSKVTQIAWCNRLANRDKTIYYRKLISDNGHDSKKLWRELHKVLNRSHGTTLPTHESSKALADRFATFFSNKT